nr:formate/nitrite transporter family protein [Nakamurella antarctica]
MAAGEVSTNDGRPEPEVEEAFDRLVKEGTERLSRPFLAQFATTFLGGIDIGTGVLAYLVVREQTDNPVLSGLAFSIGFVALLLARSELFTENFLVPVTAVVAKAGTLRQLFGLWGFSLAANLAGGWLMMLLLMTALPDLRETAIEAGTHYAQLGINAQSFTLAMLAGLVITLMTRMQHASGSLGVQLVPAVLFGALLAVAGLFHCVLDSLLMFAALISGAPFGYADWLGAFAWSALGNVVGAWHWSPRSGSCGCKRRSSKHAGRPGPRALGDGFSLWCFNDHTWNWRRAHRVGAGHSRRVSRAGLDPPPGSGSATRRYRDFGAGRRKLFPRSRRHRDRCTAPLPRRVRTLPGDCGRTWPRRGLRLARESSEPAIHLRPLADGAASSRGTRRDSG